jgi:hypothetical protein
MAIYSNITIDQGSDFQSEVTVEDTTGGVADLSGYTAYGQIRRSYKSLTATDFVCSIPNPVAGIIKITLTSTTTNSLKSGRYVYDIEIQSATGSKTRVIEGQVTVTPGVTQTI